MHVVVYLGYLLLGDILFFFLFTHFTFSLLFKVFPLFGDINGSSLLYYNLKKNGYFRFTAVKISILRQWSCLFSGTGHLLVA